MALEELLSVVFFDNTIGQYLFALAVFFAMVVAAFVFKRYVLHLLGKIASKTKIEYDDVLFGVIKSIRYPFYLVLAFYVALWFLVVPVFVSSAAYYLFLIGVLYYAVRALQVSIDSFAREFERVSGRKGRLGGRSKAIEYLSKIGKIGLWFFAALVLMSSLGFEITPIVAGLGIGGIAIALALQSILGDVFNFFAIYLDKPFMEGDFLIIGEDMGTVEKIGLRSTRIKTLRGEELVVSNNDLTSNRIHNFKKMDYRRVAFSFGIAYNTPVKKLKKIPKIVKQVIESAKKTRFDRAHFSEFGDSSLKFEVVYFLDSNDYNEYMDTQQLINLGIKKAFEKEGIEFAFPTQTIYLAK